MNIEDIKFTDDFLKEAKSLSRHYKSFKTDLRTLLEEIVKSPSLGIDLGNGLRKIRMAIASKGKGKSGGARVITLSVLLESSDKEVTLIYVYDKSKKANISKNEINAILKKNGLIE